MARPGDWSPLELSADPTPGDPDRLDRVISSIQDLVNLAADIDSGLTDVQNTSAGVFVGKTADALRDVIDGRVRHYISTFKQAHVDVHNALNTYVGVMRAQQQRADAALSAAAALSKDDKQGRAAQKSIAQDAKATMDGAATTAATALRNAANSIASPVDDCAEFWKALTWIAIILIVPAIIVGGPLALFAIALNVALMIKTAVDYAHGNATVTDLVLGVLGVIAPTTKGLNLGALWKSIRGLGVEGLKGAEELFLGGANSFGLWTRTGLGIDSAASAAGTWVKGGLSGLKLAPDFRGVPGFAFGKGGALSIMPLGAELTVINMAGATRFFGLRSLITTINAVRGVGAGIVDGLSGWKGLRLFLPVAADEMGGGIGLALKIGFYYRGVLGMYRYGAFVDGKFLGAASKISGVAGAGFDAFHAANVTSLQHLDFGGLRPGGVGTPPVPGLFANGLSAVPPVHIPDWATSLSGGFSVGQAPPLSVYVGDRGGLGALVPFSPIDAKLTDLPSVSFGGMNLSTLSSGLAVPSGISGLGSQALSSLPPTLGHVSVPGLNSITSALPPVHFEAPGANGQMTNLPNLATPSLSSAALPSAQTPSVSSLGSVTTPSLNALGTGLSGHALQNVALPAMDARVVDLPHGIAAVNPAVVSVPNIAAAPIAAHLQAPNISGLTQMGSLGLPSGLSHLDSLAGFPGAPDLAHLPGLDLGPRNYTVLMVNGISYDFQHTFSTIPGLPGVEVRVFPTGHPVDIQIHPAGRSDVTASYQQLGDQHIVRVEQALAGGQVHRWDFELSAANNHRLLADQVIDAQVTGSVPGMATELQQYSAHTVTPGPSVQTPVVLPHTTGGGPIVQPTALLPHTGGPGTRLIDIPGLTGAQVEVRVGADGGVTGVRPVSGPTVPALNTQHVTGPAGVDIVRVEQTVVPNVEVRRWDFQLGPAGAQLAGIERHITLTGGPADGTRVAIPVDALNRPSMGIVQHFARDGGAPVSGPVRVSAAGIVVRTPTGFELYDPATGAPTHAGLQLGPATGPRNLPVHVLTPHAGGDPTLVGADATGNLGTVTVPPNANGVLHVIPGTGGPIVSVFGANGRFSHAALPLIGAAANLPGGFVRLPGMAPVAPQLVDAAGTAVPHSHVVPQQGGGFRVQYAGGHITVDAAGAHQHDVVPLTPVGGGAPQHYVFTPVAAPHNPTLHGPNGQPVVNTVTRTDDTFHVSSTNHRVDVYTPNGAFSHTALPITTGGAVPGGFIHLPRDGSAPQLVRGNGTPIANSSVVGQRGEFVVGHPGGSLVVDATGAHTHDLVPLSANGVPTGQLIQTPVATPNVPLPNPRGADGHAVGNITVTRVGTDFRLTTPDGSFAVFNAAGVHQYDAIHVQGGPFAGNFVRTDPTGAQLVDAHLAPVGGARVVPQTGLQGGGFRVQSGAGHIVVDAAGVHRFDVTTLHGTDGRPVGQYVFTPVGTGAPLPIVKGPDGGNLGVSVTARPGGVMHVFDPGTIRVFHGDGVLDLTVQRLTDATGAHLGENIRVLDGGALRLVDDQLGDIAGLLVQPRPGGGFHVQRPGNGGFSLFDANGRLDFAAVPMANVMRVSDGAGVHQFDVISLGDARSVRPAMAQFVDITPGGLRLLDGHLNALPHPVQPRPGGGYRVDGVGLQVGEIRDFDAAGRLEFQRVNILNGGTVDLTRRFEITYPAAGTPTWSTAKFNAHGVRLPAPATRTWFEGGTVDVRGADVGRIHLVSHTGTTVFERFGLPGGGTLDAHHSTGSLGTFNQFNQRGHWAEFDAAGNLVDHGTRHWGESTRSYFDVKKFVGLDVRVRHFQMSADGGHVLADLGHVPATQSFADTRWTRFDANFQPIAEGVRHWGPGRGFTDVMTHPITGANVKVQIKFGRFQPNLHDVRRYHEVQIGADGIPARDYISRHPDGNVNGYGKTLENGDFLILTRFAEQRPPVAFRNLFSPTLRNTDLSQLAWLRDSRLRVGTWRQEPAAGGAGTSGSHFIANNKATFDVARDGTLVRETRTMLNGSTLTVGDVALPHIGGQTVPHQPGYLPWSEGAGNLQGHRTFQAGDFVATRADGTRNIAWQDRYTNNPHDGDWYTPDPAKQWNVIRTGYTDGTYADFRPPGAIRPGAAAGNAGAGFRGTVDMHNGDWTVYNHHGVVVSRHDTFPNPFGGGQIHIIGTLGAGGHDFRWHDAANPNVGGVRTTAFERQINDWGWDRESFQDFDANGRLVRAHSLLADGVTVDGWRGVDQAGNEIWHWNKTDQHGNILDFGTGGDDRVRHWFDEHGNPSAGWIPNGRWSDQLTSLGNQVVHEIPAPKPVGGLRAFFTDSPWRVRDYRPTLTTQFDANIWKEFDHGIVTRQKIQLPDNTFLETDSFNKHARRYGPDGVTLINDRSIPGYITEFNAQGVGHNIGRETHFTGVFNEYRGVNRVLREANRWEFGPSVQGEAVYSPFVTKALTSVGIDMVHEWILDFTVNLVVLALVRFVNGKVLDGVDVARAAFGATLSAVGKGSVASAHFAAGRGGWKVLWSNVDYGQAPRWRPNDDSWNTEWGANERPTRWRGGTYDFALGLGTGAVSSFVSGAAQSAIFGARASDGTLVHLAGKHAAIAGAASIVGGLLDATTVSAIRTLIQGLIGSRWIHRQGPMDIFVVGALGKFADKIFGLLAAQPLLVKWFQEHEGLQIVPVAPGSGGDR